MLENRGVPEKEFQLFVPDLQKPSSKKIRKKYKRSIKNGKKRKE